MADLGWITSQVAVGSAPFASDIPALQRAGVTDVLDLRAEADSSAMYQGTRINYYRVPMVDDGRHQPAQLYQQGVQIIQQAVASGGKILIHCAAGEYRSPSMAYAYLRSVGYSPTDAWNMVVAGRPVAHDQYVSSAEAAVPYLPSPSQQQVSSGTAIAIAAIVAGLAGLGIYYASQRVPVARYSRPKSASRRSRSASFRSASTI